MKPDVIVLEGRSAARMAPALRELGARVLIIDEPVAATVPAFEPLAPSLSYSEVRRILDCDAARRKDARSIVNPRLRARRMR